MLALRTGRLAYGFVETNPWRQPGDGAVQVLQLTCPDGTYAGMVVSFACPQRTISFANMLSDLSGTFPLKLWNAAREREGTR